MVLVVAVAVVVDDDDGVWLSELNFPGLLPFALTRKLAHKAR